MSNKVFIGNYDGVRQAAVKANSQKDAAYLLHTTVYQLRQFFSCVRGNWIERNIPDMKPGVVYFKSMIDRHDTWKPKGTP